MSRGNNEMPGKGLISASLTDPTITDEMRKGCTGMEAGVDNSTDQILKAIARSGNNGLSDPTFDALIDERLSRSHCNIFVLNGFSFGGNETYFTIHQNHVMVRRFSEQFDIFNEDVKNFPALFITANHGRRFGRSDDLNQMFYYGKIFNVTAQGKKQIKIDYRKLYNKPMPQQRLNEIAVKIGINTVPGVDLLSQTNWLVKTLDIRKVLIDNGICYS
jgi:hypothetical protein